MTAAVSASPAAVWKALARRLSQPGRARMKVFDADTKAYQKTRLITDKLPSAMAAVYLYNQRRTTLIALDFDSKVHGSEQVDADVERARSWLSACGARMVSDRSTNGGRHLLIPLAIGTTASFDELQPLLRQLKARLPSLDITPMQNAAEGCISVPGTPCRGGYRTLDGSLIDAVNDLTERSAPTLLPELHALMGTIPASPAAARTPAPGKAAHTTGSGDDERLVERYRWTKPLPADVVDFASKGTINCPSEGQRRKAQRSPHKGRKKKRRNPGCFDSPSEARMSVVFHAVLRGHSLADLRAASRPGQHWSGLGDSYRKKYDRKADDQLARDVRQVLDYTAVLAAETNRSAHRFNYPQGGIDGGSRFGDWLAYAWAWADHEFSGSPLRWTVRDVFQALAVKAVLAGTVKAGVPVVGVGGRSLSLSGGLMAPTTVFEVLRRTRDMVGSPIVLVRPRVGREADFYALTATNPDGLRPVPRDRVAVRDVHPAWSILGRQHRFIHELITETGLTRPADIYAAARVSARSGQLTLAALTTAGLITRVGRFVGPGSVSLDDIAAAHHLDETMAERIARFRRERAAWHDWLALQDELRGLAAPENASDGASAFSGADLADQDEYLAAVLAHGPPPAADEPEPPLPRLQNRDEADAIELLESLLGARVLAGPAAT
mgnify:FL=1